MTDDYRVVSPPAVFTVVTVVPYADGPEYREYEVPSDELPTFKERMADPEFREQVISVERGTRDGDE